jgi:serine/threonine-protein kinase RsbW
MPGDLECLGVLDRLITGISERMGFDEEARDAVGMSVIEAGTNAIQHGCRMDASRTVEFVFELHPDRLVVSVHDPGPGFDPSVLPTEILPEDLFRERGRGVYIMRSLMDRVEFDIRPGGGTVIRLTKLGPSGNGDRNSG